jgi:hypothetical protein
MTEPYLTIAEIEAQYPKQWVLVGDLKKGRDGFAVGGVVYMHTPDRAEFDRRLVDNDEFPQLKEIMMFYTTQPKMDDDILEPLSESA